MAYEEEHDTPEQAIERLDRELAAAHEYINSLVEAVTQLRGAVKDLNRRLKALEQCE